MFFDVIHVNSVTNVRKTHHQFHVPYNVGKQSTTNNWNVVAFKINNVNFVVTY